MYDRFTDELIRTAPSLDGLDRDRLPMMLTDAFARIVALRVRLEVSGDLAVTQRTEINEQILFLRRLANTYETLACLARDNETRRPCAFVAATAHQLLHRALSAPRSTEPVLPTTPEAYLKPDGISSQVAALLLFFIAGAFPDAAEVASQIVPPVDASVESLLVRAIVSLAQGRLDEITGLPGTSADSSVESLDAQVTAAMWRRLYSGLRTLSSDLLLGPALRGDPTVVFEEIRRLAVAPVNLGQLAALAGHAEAGPGTCYEIFGGPHHLATLLSAGSLVLLERAVTQVPPPDPDIAPEEWTKFLERIARTRPCLWPNHLDALSKGFLTPGTSAAISFPTGSGKSTLVQLKIEAALLREKRTVFLVPTHALVDQTRRDLQKVFPRARVSVSPLMDDLGDDEEARIDVMTPERCLARLGVAPDSFEGVGLVVFDECHLLHPKDEDDDRRSVDAMLCLLNLINLAKEADVVLLSAMMANAVEMSEWISTLGPRRCIALDMDWKPTRQARGCLVYRSEDVTRLEQVLIRERAAADKKATESGKKWSGKPGVAVNRMLSLIPFGLFSLRHMWATASTADYSLHRLLAGEVDLTAGGGPFSWYLTTNRNKVSAALAAGYAVSGIRTMVLAQAARDLPSLAQTAAQLLKNKRTPATLEKDEQRFETISIEELGDREHAYLPVDGLVAIHHGMMLPSERRLSERLFGRVGGLSVLAVSPTLAQGVNLPADAIIIAGDDRYDIKADARAALAAHEVLNAAGRAGRAGSSALGLVLVVPGAVVSFDDSTKSVQQHWFELQDRVFSKSDQCLEIRDPIEKWLDRLQQHSADQPLDSAAEYFVTRLPVDPDGSGAGPRTFLSRTLAAYHAKKRGTFARYETLVEHVISLRTQHAGHTGSWHDSVSAATGVPVQMIRELDAALLAESDEEIEARDVLSWVDWWFEWLQAKEERVRVLLGEHLFQRLYPAEFKVVPRPDDLLTRLVVDLKKVVLAWMNGSPLKAIEKLLGATDEQLGHCEKAREFAIRHSMTVAYAAGLVARVREAQTAEQANDLDDPVDVFLTTPIALATLHSCIREGFETPEQLALYNLNGEDGARVGVHREYGYLDPRIEARSNTESFKDTQKRVREVVRESLG